MTSHEVGRYYHVTVEGEMFSKAGGYAKDIKNREAKNNQISRNERLVILGTWFAGFGALSLTIWEIWKYYHCGCK